MLEQLSISNFKCFAEKTTFSLKSLNVFSGLNGRGKSTVFQSLLMLSQSLNKNGNIEYLYVNGDYVNLDLFDDILNFKCSTKEHKDKTIRFELTSDNQEINKIELGYKEHSERVGVISELKINNENYFQKGASIGTSSVPAKKGKDKDSFLYGYPKDQVNSLFRNVYYISADRLGPTRDERKADEYTHNPLGVFGEHRLNILYDKDLSINAVRFDETQGTLLDETSKWLAYIMDGAKLSLRGEDKEDSVLQLFLSNNEQYDKKIKAINFGYGYSYILSIILIALLAKPDSLVFVENPEAHLHPRAQSRLTELLCKLSEIGVQVFIETHSEHVINRARLSVLKDNTKLTHKDVSIYFFGEKFDITHLEMNEDAQFLDANCLTGFLDQQEIDTGNILKLGLFR
ncbi:MAG: AAA family ATPase [Dysgonomonas sp.]